MGSKSAEFGLGRGFKNEERGLHKRASKIHKRGVLLLCTKRAPPLKIVLTGLCTFSTERENDSFEGWHEVAGQADFDAF